MSPRGRRSSQLIANKTGTGILRKHRPDYNLVIITALLLVVGLITIYAISPGLAESSNISSSYFVEKQLLAIALGIVGFGVAVAIPVEFWKRYVKQLVIISILAAFVVRLIGTRVNGAYRWIQIGGFSFQAVELIKFTILIWLASFFAERIRKGEIRDFKKTFKPLVIALIVVGVVVAGLESDLGSTGVIVIMMGVVAFIAGLPFKRVLIIGCIVGAGLIIAVGGSSYREQRLFTFLHPTQNCQTTGSGYQACQALIAVGSGGLFGKGLARSIQINGYLPEADNDSIFAVYAEQFGFVGSVILLGLFMALFIKLKNLMEKAPDNYTRFIVAGVLGWLAFQTLVNVGAMIGLIPLKGITLPLISYGGTSIVFVLIAIGLVFNISYYTTARLKEDDLTTKGDMDEDLTLRRWNGRSYHSHFGDRT